jgi:hypothetical protein
MGSIMVDPRLVMPFHDFSNKPKNLRLQYLLRFGTNSLTPLSHAIKLILTTRPRLKTTAMLKWSACVALMPQA